MNRCVPFRGGLLFLFLLACSCGILAQTRTAPASVTTAQIPTGNPAWRPMALEFPGQPPKRAQKPVSPSPAAPPPAAPPVSDAFSQPTPPPSESPEGSVPAEKPPAEPEPPRPLVELHVARDANGNWILTSNQLPGTAPAGKVAFNDLKVSTGKAELDQLIEEAGRKYGVDPRLIYEVMRQESGFRQYAVSPAGAKGLMQFIPGTAARMGISNVFDMRQSVEGGAKYLRQLLDMFNGNVELALAGYNAGEHRVIRNGYQVPRIRETQNYVTTIMARYRNKHHTVAKSAVKKNVVPPPDPMRVEEKDGVVLLTNR